MRFRGDEVERVCYTWNEALNDSIIENHMGHDPLPWVGYTWFYDPRFVDENLGCADRAPWVTSDITLTSPSPSWHTHAGLVPRNVPVPVDEEDELVGDDQLSDDNEDPCARWIIDSGTTFHIISDRDVERAGLSRLPVPKRSRSARPTGLRMLLITSTSHSRGRTSRSPLMFFRTPRCSYRCASCASTRDSDSSTCRGKRRRWFYQMVE